MHRQAVYASDLYLYRSERWTRDLFVPNEARADNQGVDSIRSSPGDGAK